MSQTDPVQDVGGDAAQNSSRDSSQSKEPPSLQELRAAAGAARDSVKELDDELQKMAAGHNAENQHRAKKAQKTKGRVKINAPPEQEKKPKHQPDPELDEDEDDEEIEEEPSKLVPAILGCFQAVGGFIKKIFQFIWGLIMRVFGVLLGLVKLVGRLVCKLAPLLVGVPLYCLVLYLSSEYIVNHFDSAQHLDMGFRLNYLLRCHAFTMIPVLLGLVVSGQVAGETHQRFYHEAFEQSVLLIVNTLIMTAHCGADQLHWLCCITIGYLAFSLPYWISLGYGGSKIQSTLRSPVIVTNIALMLYNVVVLGGQFLGCGGTETRDSPSDSAGFMDFGTQTDPEDYKASSTYSWWYYLFPPGLLAVLYQNQHLIL